MKNNINVYEKGLINLVLVLAGVCGYFIYEKFGLFGIIVLIVVAYLLLLGIPNLFNKKKSKEKKK